MRYYTRHCPLKIVLGLGAFAFLLGVLPHWTSATPANKAGLEAFYDKFLSKDLNRCTTCHLPSDQKNPESLAEFPHNPFGHRLRMLGSALSDAGKNGDIPRRLELAAQDDSDGDGLDNQTEILLGHNPGDPQDKPARNGGGDTARRLAEFKTFLASYRWRPYEAVTRPPMPKVKRSGPIRNSIDAFVWAELEKRNLKPSSPAPKRVLLRRVYLDLIGLLPTEREQRDFVEDRSPQAYEKVVDLLLNDPRHGERWGRHWMDVWRYSDWAGWSGGNQIRDSKPHIWRWRDWIVESLNQDKAYDRMIIEMLAADELAPADASALRATGYLVRNFKLLSREQWLEDTVKHTGQAFLGLTIGCAKCHDHMYDPIAQSDYYRMRAIFEPHQVRTDRLPGELDRAKAGLVRAYDTDTNLLTYFFNRGDERTPDTNRVMKPGVPKALSKTDPGLHIRAVDLPFFAAFPDKREFVIQETVVASEKALLEARENWEKIKTEPNPPPEKLKQQELQAAIAAAKNVALKALLRAEKLEDQAEQETDEWKEAAMAATASQREETLLEARLRLHLAKTAEAEAERKLQEAKKTLEAAGDTSESQAGQAAPKNPQKENEKAAKDLESARKKIVDEEKLLSAAEKEAAAPLTTAYKPRTAEVYPATSTGRRLAFARWLADGQNPLTARVAVNHIWLRHFGRGIVPTVADFGRNGQGPTHPALLDWLAAELMAQNWSMKALHRLMVTSSTYRLASTPHEENSRIDPDNYYLWRMRPRRMEAEVVRDNLLYVSGDLDPTMGGPDIDHNLGMTSKRRSIYLRQAAEKEVEFLKIFDGPSVTECYQRRPSVAPQQALALANSPLVLTQAHRLATSLSAETAGGDREFVTQAFAKILTRPPTAEELRLCHDFLNSREDAPSGAIVPSLTASDNIPAGTIRKTGQRRANGTGSSGGPPSVDHQNAGHSPGRDASEPSPSASSFRARERLLLVLFNHNEFVTIR